AGVDGAGAMRRPLLLRDILTWADAFREATGRWPTKDDGDVAGAVGETWLMVDHALREGLRGLSGGSSLARLLARHRGARNRKDLPPLPEGRILTWADALRARTGSWPSGKAGAVAAAPGETWTAVEMALHHGRRGLPGGSSLALLLADRRGARNCWNRPDLSVAQV